MNSAETLQLAIEQIKSARAYTLPLLTDVEDELWFVVPPGATTHIAWQVGHVAMAEYGLCLFRQRGRMPIDLELMPSKFRKQYSRGTTPDPDPADQPSPAELRTTMERIHQQCLEEMPGLSPESLAEPVEMPYMAYPNKLGALLFASHHEMIHAGQIGVLRRLLGKSPIR